MKPNEILNLTIERFDLKAVDLCRSAGVSPAEMSRFRAGKQDFCSSRLLCVVRAMPRDARHFFWGVFEGLIAGGQSSEKPQSDHPDHSEADHSPRSLGREKRVG